MNSNTAPGQTNPSFVLKAVQEVCFEDRPIPTLKSDYDVVVHVQQTGICGSDVHYWQRGRIGEFIVNGPMVLGHESSGVVWQVGSAVVNLKPGDRVAVEPGVPCRRCQFCRKGAYYNCGDMVFAATPPNDGTLAKYYVSAFDYCYKVPDHVSMEEAAMVEPVAVACSVCETADLRAGQTVIVMGCGPIGVLCQAVAKQAGVRLVIGVDIVPSRLEVAKRFGADGVFLPPSPKSSGDGVDPMAHATTIAQQIWTEFGLLEDGGADVVLECSGAEPSIQLAVAVAKKSGIIVQAGMGKEMVQFPITAVCTKSLQLRGSIRYKPSSYPRAVDLIARGKIDVTALITHRYKFEDAEAAFELVKAGRSDVFKVMIEGVHVVE